MEKRPKLVVGVLFIKDNQILLLKRNKPTSMFWGLCGGKIDYNETIEEAAIRETKEEVAIDVLTMRFLGFSEHLPEKIDKSHRVFFVYLADKWNGEPINKEPDKHEKVEWHSMDKLPSNIGPAILYWLEKLDIKYAFKSD